MANILYKKLKRQYTDNGVSWIDMNVYKVGDVLEDPSNCQSENTKQCRWVELDLSEGYTCVGDSKYTLEVEECSTDGIIWTRTGNQREGVMIDKNSMDCGYIAKDCSNILSYEDSGYLNSTVHFNPNFTYDISKTAYIETTIDEDITNYADEIFPETTMNIYDIPCFTASSSMRYTFSFNQHLKNLDVIKSINTSNVTEFSDMFKGSSNLRSIDLSNLSLAKAELLQATFCGCSHLKTIDLSNRDAIKLSSLSNIASGCYSLETVDLSNLNTPNLVKFTDGFRDCYNLRNVNLTNLNTNKLKKINDLFHNCLNLQSLDLSTLNLSEVIETYDFSGMFYNCISLSNIVFPKTVLKADEFASMFRNCLSLTSIDMSMFSIENGILLKTSGMFYCCENVLVIDLRNFNVDRITSMNSMFSGCKNLTTLYLDKWNAIPVGDAFTSGNNCIFTNCYSLKTIYMRNSSSEVINFFTNQLNKEGFTTSVSDGIITITNTKEIPKLISDVEFLNSEHGDDEHYGTDYNRIELSDFIKDNPNLFKGYDHLIRVFKFPSSTNITNMKGMFYNCDALYQIDGISDWDVSKVTNMAAMFWDCNSLLNLDISNWDTSNVTDMTQMFNNCSNLLELKIGDWNVSKVTSMNGMFTHCELIDTMDLKNWNTSNVTNMYGMFKECINLKSLNVSNWKTSKVTNMNSMFYNCYNLKSLNLSSFDTSNVTGINAMFYECRRLVNLDLSNWDLSKVEAKGLVFYHCKFLEKVIVKNCDTITKQLILDELNTYYTATLSGDIITVIH